MSKYNKLDIVESLFILILPLSIVLGNFFLNTVILIIILISLFNNTLKQVYFLKNT